MWSKWNRTISNCTKGCCLFKASLKLNDLYDTTCMTHNQFSDFHYFYTIIQVVHTEFIKVVLTDYSVFKSSRNMTQEQVAACETLG